MNYLHYSKYQNPGVFTTTNNNYHWGNNLYVNPPNHMIDDYTEALQKIVELHVKLTLDQAKKFVADSVVDESVDEPVDESVVSEYLKEVLKPIQLFKKVGDKIVEAKFEQIRNENFSFLPSRQKCMWLFLPTVNKELVLNQIGFSDGRWYDVEILSGKCHVSNFKYLNCSTGPSQKIIESANNYWSFTQSQNDNPNELEVLFEGTCKITSIA